MLYENVDFKTLSNPYTKSRMQPFLTHKDGVRANLFSINPRQKMTSTMVNQQLFYVFFFFFFFFFFFHLKNGTNKLFPFVYDRGTTFLSEINCCVFMKLQRQLCDGMTGMTTNTSKNK